uniref:F-box domain-containing protein n=1 Tax=Caenorhabditis tropicalis TaxID=1561998 RepID=A0A1I7UT68_9PELO
MAPRRLKKEGQLRRQSSHIDPPTLQSTNRFPSTMSFVLLPDLVLEEIFKSLSMKEMHTKSHSIKIIVVDEKFERYVQIFHNHREIFKILIKTKDKKYFDSLWRFQTVVPVRYEWNTLVSYWKREVQGFQEILNYFNGLFLIEEVSFEFKQSNSHRIVPIVEYCFSKNLKIGSVDWPTFSESDEMTKRLLMASRGARDLDIKGFNSPSTHFNHFHLLKIDRLHIRNASWMTAEQAVALRNCKKISLGSVWLNEEDINRILREYIKNPGELQELRMSCYNDIIVEDMVKGLKIVRVNDGNMVRDSKYWFIAGGGIRFSAMRGWMGTIVIKRDP